MTSHPLNDRAQQLLKLIIEHYINNGQPVGSKTLAENTTLSVSSATIRNIMSDLESRGYLQSPHTSAGRIPTDKGYRLFINNLLTVKPLQEGVIESLQVELSPNKSVQVLLQTSSTILSKMTKMAGLVTLPKRKRMILRQVEFLPLASNRVLIILVFNEKEVQNRIIHTDKTYSPSELEQAGNYITQCFAGTDLRNIRQALIHRMTLDRGEIHRILNSVHSVVDQVFEVPEQEQAYLMGGHDHLIEMARETGVEQISALFDTFNQKRDMLALLDHCLAADGVQIFIGEESGYTSLAGISVVTSPYCLDDTNVGVIGVIGPSRMHYNTVIPMVDISAKLLSAALN